MNEPATAPSPPSTIALPCRCAELLCEKQLPIEVFLDLKVPTWRSWRVQHSGRALEGHLQQSSKKKQKKTNGRNTEIFTRKMLLNSLCTATRAQLGTFSCHLGPHVQSNRVIFEDIAPFSIFFALREAPFPSCTVGWAKQKVVPIGISQQSKWL